jgi:hypothetical protein
LITPVIFLVFNRPDLTARVLERIRAARPAKLLVVCDGPRAHLPDEAKKVAAVRRLIDEGVDWPCEVLCNYAEKNLGCRVRVSSGLIWAFNQVPEAIVLEDDCLPDPSFFPFCEELLTRYRDDERVMHIAGTNLSAPYVQRSSSYWFSHQPCIWGWASWSRAWRHYDLEMKSWNARADALRLSFASNWETHYWLPILAQAYEQPEKTNTWDFAWTYTCRSLLGLCIIPQNNLVENLGFGSDASHTTTVNPRLQAPVASAGPMRHPPAVTRHRFGDEMLTRVYAGQRVDFFGRLQARIRVLSELRRDRNIARLQAPQKPALDPSKC